MNAFRVATVVTLISLVGPSVMVASSVPAAPGGLAAVSADHERPATELRVAFSQLLGEHAFLIMETMRAASLGQGEEAALRAALDDNSALLERAIAGVYGAPAGREFAGLWKKHVDLLLAYADAGRRGDAAAAVSARQGLGTYVEEFSEFLSAANPDLLVHEEAAALDLHVDQLTAFADGNYAAAYEAQRLAFGHMFDLGDHLALGIARQFPERYPDGAIAFSPRADLRLALDRLLAEHLVLAAEAMRSGVAETPDFEAASGALALNTVDLAAAVGSIYGPEAGGAFSDVWAAHVDAYLRFVTALGSGDDASRSASLAELHGYHDRVAEFLAAANPHLKAADVAGLVRGHVQALISQAEATAEADHERAIATTREAYAGMFDVGAALAEAIVMQFPDRFRDLRELPATSSIGAARPEGRGLPTGAFAGLVVVLAAATSLVAIALRPRMLRGATAADRR